MLVVYLNTLFSSSTCVFYRRARGMKWDMWKYVSHGVVSLLFLVKKKQSSGASVKQSMHRSTPTLRGSEREPDRYKSWRWMRCCGGERRSWIEREMQDKEERHSESEREKGHASSCQGIDVSLQISSVTSATKSPSNCSPVPKHLANAQLMSTDAVSHWFLGPLSADRLVRWGGVGGVGGDKIERKGEEERWQHVTEWG